MASYGILLKQGAEAKVYKSIWNDQVVIIKERFSKTWRNPTLDKKLRKHRLKQESNCLKKAFLAGIPVPIVYQVDKNSFCLYLEYIEGQTLRNALDNRLWFTEQRKAKFEELGALLARLHDNDIVHEDLTTSNIMVREATGDLVLIDFGLSHVTLATEDKAVDLYVLERAFISTHPFLEAEFEALLEAYAKTSSKGPSIMKKLSDVRLRGRKRTMIG